MFSDKLRRRFWKKVQKALPGECWIWQAYCDEHGYGRFWFGHIMRPAHVVSWMMHFGPMPDDIQVLHECDNPPCVNPIHLFLGTHQANMTDKVVKDRQSKLKGEANPFTNLTDADVIRMRRLYKTKKYLQRHLAEMFGFKDVGHVSEILRGVRWQHLNEIEPPIQPFQGVVGRKRKGVGP